MRDEHLIYTDLEEGKIKITPEDGYRLYCKLTKAYMSEAICTERDIKNFISVSDNREEC